ncbi:MAG: hypothetical protein QM758_16275 [Armatimonas sp.]
MHVKARGNLAWGIALVPVALVGVTGAIRASQPLLTSRQAPAEVHRVAAQYAEVATYLRNGRDMEAIATWSDLQNTDMPLVIPNEEQAEVGDFTLQMALFDACETMSARGGQWTNRCLTLAKRLEDTPNQTEIGLELAWRIKRQAIAPQPRTAEAMASASIP